jgi:hypothetical protein
MGNCLAQSLGRGRGQSNDSAPVAGKRGLATVGDLKHHMDFPGGLVWGKLQGQGFSMIC